MLHLHRSERADRLIDALAEILARPPADPFTPDLVAVPTRGMERWLSQRLSDRLGAAPGLADGVCANVVFPFPGRLIGAALATASGIDADEDPWAPERMVWPLIGVIEACLEEGWLAPLAGHLAQGRERRYAHVREIAWLYDSYSFRRPELILSWVAGHGEGWQPELWRRLREEIAVPCGAERIAPACERLAAEPDLLGLPGRLGLFGLTRLPPSYLEALHALALHRDVHLFLLHPSPALWEKVAESVPDPPRSLPRSADPSAGLPANRLLASWGRDSRELQLVLGAGGPAEDRHHPIAGPRAGEPPTLLRALQDDIRADRAPAGPRLAIEPGEDSIRIHACHGRQRQVEVLREAVLHRLAADPTLEPRDVIVMCPDIEAFAPLIEAAFGTGRVEAGAEGEAPLDLRVRLADRSLRQTNPVLSVVARLLELTRARFTASELLDFADTEPVRRRFHLDDDDLARIHDWIVAGAIHWGFGGPDRRAFGLQIEEGTWSAGLRRLLLGTSLSESGQRMFGGVLPVDDVDSGDIELVGRFAELVDRLSVAVRALSGPHSLAGWASAIASAADALTLTAERDSWQRHELARILDGLLQEDGGRGRELTLALPEIRSLLGERLAGRPTRANFRTGHLTVCTLHPMRSVPHRVVCLLGLDDGAFPRRTPRNGDDLLLEHPHVGDRDPRAEDRQLLLDALLAAEEALIVTYSGHDERTNALLPPAVPVGELLDAIDAIAEHPAGPAHRHVLVHHPLQPFDPRNFEPGRLHDGSAWSFDPVALAGAAALESPRRPSPPFLERPLAPPQARTLALADLIAFVERPVQAFLRQRLRIASASYEDELDDALPVELDGLKLYGVGQRLLEAMLSGSSDREACLAEYARGTLPPGDLGVPVIRQVWGDVEALVRQARADGGSAPPRSIETNFWLPLGAAEDRAQRVTGTVGGVRDSALVTVSYARLSGRHRLAAWVRLLALTAAHPEVGFEAITIGRAASDADARLVVARIPSLAGDESARRRVALSELAGLAVLRELGMREPLPLPCATAAAWAQALLRDREDREGARRAALGEWESGWRYPREDQAGEHLRAFGRVLGVDELLEIEAADGDPGDPGERSRFARLARVLWQPLLERETVSEL